MPSLHLDNEMLELKLGSAAKLQNPEMKRPTRPPHFWISSTCTTVVVMFLKTTQALRILLAACIHVTYPFDTFRLFQRTLYV